MRGKWLHHASYQKEHMQTSWWNCRRCKGWSEDTKQRCLTCHANRKFADAKQDEASSYDTIQPIVIEEEVPLASATQQVVGALAQDPIPEDQKAARTLLDEKLQRMEAAMNALPAEMHDMKQQLSAQMDSTKKKDIKLGECEPYGRKTPNGCKRSRSTAAKRRSSLAVRLANPCRSYRWGCEKSWTI